MESKGAHFSSGTRRVAVELWRAKVPLKKIMDHLQMSKSTIFAPPAPCQGKSCCPCQAQGKRELAWRNPRSWTSPSGTWRCACRCHQQGRKPYQVLASRAVHPMGPFQDQNRIKNEIVTLIYVCGVNLSVVHCTYHWTCVLWLYSQCLRLDSKHFSGLPMQFRGTQGNQKVSA